MIKVAGNFHHLDAHARQTMIAAAEAHHATGAPIGVHHELGTTAADVAELLCGQLQVPSAGGRTRRTGGSEVLHRQHSPRLQLGLNASA